MKNPAVASRYEFNKLTKKLRECCRDYYRHKVTLRNGEEVYVEHEVSTDFDNEDVFNFKCGSRYWYPNGTSLLSQDFDIVSAKF